jgi:hypothetical protein
VSGDGNNKACHGENVGTASAPEAAARCRFFGEANANVHAAHAAKQQSSPAFDADHDVGGHVCTSNLQFAREQASRKGPQDRTGICGFVCKHGTPAKGCFVDMPAPEQFMYYFYLLAYLLRRRPDMVKGKFYVDIACRLSGSWRTWVTREAVSGVACITWLGLRLVVPWMHAAAHNMACQLAFSALFEVS